MIKRTYLRVIVTFLLTLLHTSIYAVALQVSGGYNNSISPVSMRKALVGINSEGVNAPVSLVNYGDSEVKNIEYTLSFGNEIIETKELSLPQAIVSHDSQLINIHISPHTKISVTELTFNVTKVNGQPNGATIPYTTITRMTLTQVPKRKVVAEAYTAMWCGNCPGAIALIENLTHTFPDEFIGISVHSNREPLHCPSYQSQKNRYNRYPTVMFDRTTNFTYFNAASTFMSEKEKGAELDVKVSAVWDEKKNNISVTSETIFRIDMPEAPYALAYVLTADELQHSSYYQKNYYSGSTADLGITKEMDFFINSPGSIHGMKFNHVAISAMGIDTGITGSLKPSAVADEVQTHKVSFNNISQYRTIQDKSKLHVCVLVINTKTKEIVNADQCTISDSATTGIDSMADAGKAVETARYDAAGRRISHPTRGLNIVKYSDGRMVKELVK